MDEENDVYDVYGLTQYLTLYNSGSIDDMHPNQTLYPKGAKIISTNLKQTNKREFRITEKELDCFNRYFANECPKNVYREDGHVYFIDNIKHYCGDKLYIELDEEYFKNYYGFDDETQNN